MSDPMTERYGSDDHLDNEELDYEEHEPQIMWGRVVALGAAIVLAFVGGRATTGGGIPAAEFRSAQEQAAALEAENEDLRSQLALLQTENADGLPPAAEGEGEEATEEPAQSGDTEVQGITYVVKQGDNLSRIAAKFYDDATLGRFIARANNLKNPGNLSVGQKLIIPDRK